MRREYSTAPSRLSARAGIVAEEFPPRRKEGLVPLLLAATEGDGWAAPDARRRGNEVISPESVLGAPLTDTSRAAGAWGCRGRVSCFLSALSSSKQG